MKKYLVLAILSSAILLSGCNDNLQDNVANAPADTVLVSEAEEVIPSDTLYKEFTVFPTDSIYTTKVLVASVFHSDEVWTTVAKEKWVGLFKNANGYYIKQTTVKAKRVRDEIVDEENEITGWEVSTPVKDSNILLIHAADYLSDKNVPEIKLAKSEIFPGDSVVFSYNGNQYKLFATGDKTRAESETDFIIASNYKLFLTATINGKTKTQLLTAQPSFDDNMIKILFAGDLDSDGIADFIIDNSYHYNMINPVLYLSKPAGEKEVVKPVGGYVSVGC